MIDDSEIEDISNVYKDMNTEGKKKMVQAAKKLLDGQFILRDSLSEKKRKTQNLKLNDQSSILDSIF
ncbi:hypothetical protein FACS1894142_5280 [Spirochaetia bacterium]|nr:hypothetical protein FACS1894142_5280 [Spirochaetia bacterium]